MPSGSSKIGQPEICNLTRSEDDTDDITVHLSNDVNNDEDVTGWSALLSVSATADGAPLTTFAGAGVAADGDIPIDMATFVLVPGDYFYDIRITDVITVDNPDRVYFKGTFEVTDRIK